MAYARVNDVNLYFEVHGEGEPLVLIIGHGSNALRWFRQIPELSRHYRVITFDNRGAGRSDAPDMPYTMAIMADDVAGLLDYLKIDRTHVWGTALGGFIAQEFALRYPQRVLSLILGCAATGGPHAVWRQPGEARDADRTRLEQLPREERVQRGLSNMFSQGFIKSRPDVIEQFVTNAMAFVTPPHGFTRQSEAIRSFDSYDRLPSMRIPALVISAADDQIVPPVNSHIIAERIPGAELMVLEGRGHGYYVEAAEEVNRIVLEFLARHPRMDRGNSAKPVV